MGEHKKHLMKNHTIWLIVFAVCFAVGSGVGCNKIKKQRPGSGTDVYVNPIIVPSDGGFDSELEQRPGDDVTLLGGNFNSVYFEYDSAQIAPNQRTTLNGVADYLRQNRNNNIIVEGHCDERGSREYNLSLGERRALAVRSFLIGLGVGNERIQTKSMGEEQPSAFGHDEHAYRANRRTEFVVYE